MAQSATIPSAAPPDDRVAWVDTAKGICILFVVMMHSTLGVGNAMGGEGFMHWVVAFAKPFRMPDFFLISGLFLSRVIDRDWRTYADKRIVHFAYFYLLWLVIQSGVKINETGGGDLAGFGRHLALGLVEPYSTLWFIYLLAVFSAVTKALRRAPAWFLLVVGALLQTAPVQTGSTLIDEFCLRWVFFVIGYLFAPRVFALAAAVPRHRALALGLLGVWALVDGALAFTRTGLAFAPTAAELPGVSLALGLAGGLAIIAVAALLTDAGLARALRYCGRNSIAIYLAFFLPMAATRTLIVKTGVIADIGWASLLVTVVAALTPLVLERMVRGTAGEALFKRPAWAHLRPAPRAARLDPGSA